MGWVTPRARIGLFRMGRKHLFLVILLLIIGTLVACQKTKYQPVQPAQPVEAAPEAANPANALPAPGTMVVVSVQPVPLPDKPPLLPNGNFRTWDFAAGVPKGFTAPQGGKSTVTNEAGENGKIQIKQTWIQDDSGDSFLNKFGILVQGLMQDAAYNLEVRAKNLSDKKVIVSAWHETGDARKPFDRVNPGGALEIPPGQDFQVYSFSLLPKSDKPIRIIDGCAEATPAAPVTVIWDEWRLTEDKTPPPPETK